MRGKVHEAKSNSSSRDLAKPYEPAPHERAALEAYLAAKKEAPLAPRLNVTEKDGVTTIAPDHPEPALGHVLLMKVLGTKDLDFLDGILGQLANAGTQGKGVDARGLNFMLSVVKGVEPADQVEVVDKLKYPSEGHRSIAGSISQFDFHSLRVIGGQR